MKEHTDETVQPVEREDIVLGTTQWPRDWESFNQSYVGRHEAEKLSNDELIEYLRWMACSKPKKYAKVMSAFANTQRQPAGVAV